MSPDSFTVFLILSIVFISSAIFTMAIFFWRMKSAGVFPWAIGLLTFFSGFILISLRGRIPDWVSIQIANAMIIFGPAFLFHGLWKLRFERKFPVWIYFFPLAETLVFLVISNGILAPRMLLMSVFIATGTLAMSLLCYYRVPRSEKWIFYTIGFPMILIAIIQFLRIFQILGNLSMQTMFHEFRNNRVMLVALLVANTLLSFGYFLVIFHRMVESLKKKEEMNRMQMEELLRLNSTKDTLFSILGHDLRGPLASTLNLIRLKRSRNEAWDATPVIQKLGLELEKLHLLTDNLLWWANSQRNLIQPVKVDSDLTRLSGEIVSLWKEPAENKGVVVMNEIPKDFKIKSDPQLLSVLLRNLLSNAIKFTPGGGFVLLMATLSSSYWMLIVEDSGIGIEPALMQEIERKQMTGSQKGTAGEPGSGIGLMLCQEFVQLLNGKMNIESSLGKGSRISLEFPIW